MIQEKGSNENNHSNPSEQKKPLATQEYVIFQEWGTLDVLEGKKKIPLPLKSDYKDKSTLTTKKYVNFQEWGPLDDIEGKEEIPLLLESDHQDESTLTTKEYLNFQEWGTLDVLEGKKKIPLPLKSDYKDKSTMTAKKYVNFQEWGTLDYIKRKKKIPLLLKSDYNDKPTLTNDKLALDQIENEFPLWCNLIKTKAKKNLVLKELDKKWRNSKDMQLEFYKGDLFMFLIVEKHALELFKLDMFQRLSIILGKEEAEAIILSILLLVWVKLPEEEFLKRKDLKALFRTYFDGEHMKLIFHQDVSHLEEFFRKIQLFIKDTFEMHPLKPHFVPSSTTFPIFFIHLFKPFQNRPLELLKKKIRLFQEVVERVIAKLFRLEGKRLLPPHYLTRYVKLSSCIQKIEERNQSGDSSPTQNTKSTADILMISKLDMPLVHKESTLPVWNEVPSMKQANFGKDEVSKKDGTWISEQETSFFSEESSLITREKPLESDKIIDDTALTKQIDFTQDNAYRLYESNYFMYWLIENYAPEMKQLDLLRKFRPYLSEGDFSKSVKAIVMAMWNDVVENRKELTQSELETLFSKYYNPDLVKDIFNKKEALNSFALKFQSFVNDGIEIYPLMLYAKNNKNIIKEIDEGTMFELEPGVKYKMPVKDIIKVFKQKAKHLKTKRTNT